MIVIMTKYTALIVEPRQHRALEFVLENFTRLLDERWSFVICHGTDNEAFVQEIIQHKLFHASHRITLVNLHVSNLTTHDYNALLTKPQFYELIPTEHVLIFQTDAMISEKHKLVIYDFLKYDYVGAPWVNQGVGNGGLSLRKKSKMLEILAYGGIPGGVNEDYFFSGLGHPKVTLYKPTFEEAKRFSVETVYSDESFGIHNAWKYLSSEQIKSLNDYCSGLNELITLQGEPITPSVITSFIPLYLCPFSNCYDCGCCSRAV